MTQSSESESIIPHDARKIVDFWRAAGPAKWFKKDADFDAEFSAEFGDMHYRAARQELADWMAHPESALGLILLLDQYPRNAFRGTGHMFATDGLALRYARETITADFLPRIELALRGFVCLPFMHAEVLTVQEESVILYETHAPESIRWAREHRDIIQQFGRFPHRNASLGRETTTAEQRFLDKGGFAG